MFVHLSAPLGTDGHGEDLPQPNEVNTVQFFRLRRCPSDTEKEAKEGEERRRQSEREREGEKGGEEGDEDGSQE